MEIKIRFSYFSFLEQLDRIKLRLREKKREMWNDRNV